MIPNKERCPMRHENWNCLPHGGFCTAVSNDVCKVMRHAFDFGYHDALYRVKLGKRCGTCKHFIGGGDWNLCCDLPHPEYTYGFLCYEDTLACERYEVEHGDPQD